jgi:hypothetical protein
LLAVERPSRNVLASGRSTLLVWSIAFGVGHATSPAVNSSPGVDPRLASGILGPAITSETVGLGHEVNPVPSVRRTDARSREYDRPEGVSQRFQVIVNKVDPRPRVVTRNLLTKDDARLALADEMEP